MLSKKTIFLIVFGSAMIISGTLGILLDIIVLPTSIGIIIVGIALIASRIKKTHKQINN